ncbi:11909_t:CDS:2 [Ambispora gerdemannii]|uniref:11909_t:CDS:1 n=1 Tax=Ambispora gerdemannii TaxID=144530 RepID=A0A9N9BNH2_9GLOM|nr:11909_t:CDS:2 [Ambispora gerdemannii]
MDETQTERLIKIISESLRDEEAKSTTTATTTTLKLGNKGIREMPVEVIELINTHGIERLGLEQNHLTSLPHEICKLSKLRYLDLNSNEFKTFPVVLCNMQNLEVLDLSKNQIRKFPKDFGNLISLTALKISRNRIRKLPTYIGDMKNLQYLRVENNQLHFPPRTYIQMPKSNDKVVLRKWLLNLKEFLRQCQMDQNVDRNDIEFETSDSSDDDFLTQGVGGSGNGEISNNSLNTINENEQVIQRHERRRGGGGGNGVGGGPSNLILDSPRRDRSLSNDTYDPTTMGYRLRCHHAKSFSQDSINSLSSLNEDRINGGDGYFQRIRTLPSTEYLQPNDISLREASRSILYSLSQILKGIGQFTSFTATEKLFTKELRNATKFNDQLVVALEQFDSDSLTKRPDGDTCAKLLKSCQSNISVFRSLISALQHQLRNITQSSDNIRYSRTLLLMLHGAIAEIKFAWETISPLLKDYTPYSNTSTPFRLRSMSRSNSNASIGVGSGVQPPYSTGITPTNPLSLALASVPSTPYSSSIIHGADSSISSVSTSATFVPVIFNEQLMNKVETSISCVEHVFKYLMETVEQAQNTTFDDQPEIRSKIKNLELHIKSSKEVTIHLKKSLQSTRSTPTSLIEHVIHVKLYDETMAFIQKTVEMMSLVKDVMEGYTILHEQEVRHGLRQVSKSNKELLSQMEHDHVNQKNFNENNGNTEEAEEESGNNIDIDDDGDGDGDRREEFAVAI